LKILDVTDLTINYNGITALKGISFEVYEGEIVTLIGANGAGKSSMLKALSGIVPYRGKIKFKGRNLLNIPAHTIVGLGMAQVPEGRGIFGNLTVMENLKLATWQRKDRENLNSDYDYVFSLFPRLKERIKQQAGTLSGGEQQMLAMARALMTRAEMLLLDEPSMGLAPVLVKEIFSLLEKINSEGTTILLVEQNANMSLRLASRGYVLETGNITLSGTGRELLENPLVKEAYLGT